MKDGADKPVNPGYVKTATCLQKGDYLVQRTMTTGHICKYGIHPSNCRQYTYANLG